MKKSNQKTTISNANCKNCKFFYELCVGYSMCMYFLDTGIRRPCNGGAECTVKEIRKKSETEHTPTN